MVTCAREARKSLVRSLVSWLVQALSTIPSGPVASIALLPSAHVSLGIRVKSVGEVGGLPGVSLCQSGSSLFSSSAPLISLFQQYFVGLLKSFMVSERHANLMSCNSAWV